MDIKGDLIVMGTVNHHIPGSKIKRWRAVTVVVGTQAMQDWPI
jgi:hypothetical protein